MSAIKASFTMDELYFKEWLNDWISTSGRTRKYEPYLCALLLVTGLGSFILSKEFKLINFLSLVAAGLLYYSYLRFKKKWMNIRTNSKVFGMKFEFEIQNDKIVQTEPQIDDHLNVPGRKYLWGRKGLFIALPNGISLYFPYSAFNPHTSSKELKKILVS